MKGIAFENPVGFTFMLTSNIFNSESFAITSQVGGLPICTYVPSTITRLRDCNPLKIIPIYGSNSCIWIIFFDAIFFSFLSERNRER